MIADCGGLDLIERLLDHDNPKFTDWFEAFKKALVIVSVYFSYHNDDVPDFLEEIGEFVYEVIDVPPEFESDPYQVFQHLNEISPPEENPWLSFTVTWPYDFMGSVYGSNCNLVLQSWPSFFKLELDHHVKFIH
ncbi:hypothetical protein RHGRI_035597 [Rhododendron griersonianum]|uniref:Uncharacterized protein n=1 Tax=Rhododendron griersonianum TaxID=479676 RepID=A0AAV6HNT6_9ERIC|nr:hypothetical protein RHGRI_035597 [Rhododendron griersonianum]